MDYIVTRSYPYFRDPLYSCVCSNTTHILQSMSVSQVVVEFSMSLESINSMELLLPRAIYHSWCKTDYNVTRFWLKLQICYIVVRFSPQQLGTEGRVQNHIKVQFRYILNTEPILVSLVHRTTLEHWKLSLYLVGPSVRYGWKID